MTARLLPYNAEPLEVALDDVLGKPIDEMPVDLRKLWKPHEIPEGFLPWLAWAVSTDIWVAEWPPEKKRSVIADMLSLHRLKGTEAAIAKYLEIVGAELVDTLTPQDRPWALPDRAAEVTAAWKANLKQLRVYTRKTRRDALPVEHFADHAFADYAWGWPDTWETVEGRKSFIFDPKTGVETPLQRYEYDERRTTVTEDLVERSVIPRHAGPHTPFADQCFADHAFLVDQEDPEVLTTRVRIEGETFDTDLIVETLTPSMQTTDIWPDRVPIQIEHLHFAGADHAYADHCFAFPETAALGYFDRWYIVSDETPPIEAQPAGAYADFTYTQPDPYTAYLYARHHGRAKRADAFADHCFADVTFASEDDNSRLDLAWQAIRSSKALRDQIYVTFESTTPLDLTAPIPLDGSVQWGSRRPRRRL